MQPLMPSIPAPSERQAMDWSLVLASQGIETIIDRDAEAGTWQLRVQDPDYSPALRAIRQYLTENKARRWQQELPYSDLILDWRSVVPMLFLVLLHAVQVTGRAPLHAVGMMSTKAVLAGEWWRLLTAVSLHSDASHLAANATTGLLMVGLAMGAYGPGIGLLAPFLAGVIGNLAGLAFYGPNHLGLGASGMVMGAIGLLAAQSTILFRRGLAPRYLAVRSVLSGCFLLLLLGFSPEEHVDILAHVAGFVSGLGLGALLAWSPDRVLRSARWNGIAGLATAALLLGPWWLALRQGAPLPIK